MPRSIGTLLSLYPHMFRDLDEWMSLEDAYTMLEVATVDGHNNRVLAETRKREA